MVNGKGTVTIVGANKFAGITCTGTKSNMNCSEGSSESAIYAYGSISNPNEGYSDYHNVKYAINSQAEIFIKYPAIGPYTEDTLKSMCTLYGGNLNCFEMNASTYSSNKSRLQTLFGVGNCSVSTIEGSEATICDSGDGWRCEIYADGFFGFYGPAIYADCMGNSTSVMCEEPCNNYSCT